MSHNIKVETGDKQNHKMQLMLLMVMASLMPENVFEVKGLLHILYIKRKKNIDIIFC